MYALRTRGSVALALSCLVASLASACGSPSSERNEPVRMGLAGFQTGNGGFGVMTGGFGGAASLTGAGGILLNGGAPGSGGFPPPGTGGVPLGTGGVIDPGPPPTGQILDCRGTGPCRLDDHDACCIAVNMSNGTVTSMSVNCIPPNASCDYPFTIAHCDGPEDCRASEVCCGTLKPFGPENPIFGDVTCRPAGECAGSGKFIVCRAGVTACPGGTTCGLYPTLPEDMMVCH
jgi:hypothetical protein